MTDQTPAEKLKSELQDLGSTLRDLQSSARLTDLRDRLEDLEGAVNGLDQRIADLREKGYAFEKDLETQAANFVHSWGEIAPGLEREISREAAKLARDLSPLESQLADLTGKRARPSSLLPEAEQLKTALENLEGRVEAIEENIRGAYDHFQSDVHQLEHHLGRLEWTLTELSEARFQLLAAESGIMAVKAVWAKEGKQTKKDPEGVLYLTDQRIIFEQKEKVATKKVLFVATEKELVQETLWEIPVALVEEAKSRKEGFLNKDDYLELSLDSRAPMDEVHLHIWQRGDEWVALVNRARAGDFDGTRAIPIDEGILDRVKNAPTKCPSCGGAINQPILRGMESLDCEYCGDVIRI